MDKAENVILRLNNISKRFSGIEVLHGIDLSVKQGEVHALVGENGAGKSTLMKIISGLYPHGSYQGDILIDSEPVKFNTVRDAGRAGIEIISQEIELVLQLKVYENVFLGDETIKHGLVDNHRMISRTKEVFERLGFDMNPHDYLGDLGVGRRQMVAIAKALMKDARILIFDEPTAALSDAEAEKLFDIITELKSRGVTIIYISHRLNEIMKISDTITVLRDGNTVVTDAKSNFNEDRMITFMVGREMKNRYPVEVRQAGTVMLEVQNLTTFNEAGRRIVNDVSFKLRSGEVVGIAGLVGAGRTEMVKAIYGAEKEKKQGRVFLNGQQVKIKSCADAIQHGIGLVTEDRKIDGLVTCLNIASNMTMAHLQTLSRYGIMNEGLSKKLVSEYMHKLSIRAASLTVEVDRLSGGNQQKVSIAKLLMIKPKVLILDEPTRGIDVGAKYEIYKIINQLAKEGMAVLMVSSDLAELCIADRIMVMKDGRITGELEREDATPERIMYYATS